MWNYATAFGKRDILDAFLIVHPNLTWILKRSDVLLYLIHTCCSVLFFFAGITETIAQLMSGWVTDRNLFHKYHYHKAYLILCGLVNLLSPLATSYILLMVYAVFFAIFCGGYMALLLPVLVRQPLQQDQHCDLMTLSQLILSARLCLIL